MMRYTEKNIYRDEIELLLDNNKFVSEEVKSIKINVV